MEDKIIIQNKLHTTANKYTHYIHHKNFCNVCMERKVIPTGISIKKKPSISLWSEEFIADWKKVLFSAEHELLKLLHHQNQENASVKFDEFEELLKKRGTTKKYF